MDQQLGRILNEPTVPRIHKKTPPPLLPLVPAAQYVRMSDEAQQYSVDNQKAAIAEYAARHGFTVVKTYADLGKSGVVAKHRTGLGELLSDVTSGNVDYKAILVYDVSRWGRFPNSDEAAHYEFLCSNAGIPLHYCAEQFPNDGTTSSSLLKALKRSMAAEFSRELGEKVYRGKNRLVELGFWVGGKPGFGYRRRMVSANGTPKQLMKPGEHKNIKTDRVILVPGPARELRCLRLIFSLAAEGHGATAISRELNERGLLREGGKPWCACSVLFILRNPKYYGCNAWNRTTQRLQQTQRRTDPQNWILKPGAFAAIIDQRTFERATVSRPKSSDEWWSDNEILMRVRRLLKAKGRLSETLMVKARAMPALSTIHRHFGTYRQLYERVGYHLETVDVPNNVHCEATLNLRRKIVNSIQALFPDHVAITHMPGKTRSILLVDNTFMVSVVLCRSRISENGTVGWPLGPDPHYERSCITLACTMNRRQDHVLRYFLLERTDNFRSKCFNDSFLRSAIRLHRLEDFYQSVKRLWVKRKANLCLPPCSTTHHHHPRPAPRDALGVPSCVTSKHHCLMIQNRK